MPCIEYFMWKYTKRSIAYGESALQDMQGFVTRV